jgi:hypothetical protein
MSFKDILAYLDPTLESITRLRFAVDLAKAEGVRLIGADISTPSPENDDITRQILPPRRQSGRSPTYSRR